MLCACSLFGNSKVGILFTTTVSYDKYLRELLRFAHWKNCQYSVTDPGVRCALSLRSPLIRFNDNQNQLTCTLYSLDTLTLVNYSLNSLTGLTHSLDSWQSLVSHTHLTIILTDRHWNHLTHNLHPFDCILICRTYFTHLIYSHAHLTHSTHPLNELTILTHIARAVDSLTWLKHLPHIPNSLTNSTQSTRATHSVSIQSLTLLTHSLTHSFT